MEQTIKLFLHLPSPFRVRVLDGRLFLDGRHYKQAVYFPDGRLGILWWSSRFHVPISELQLLLLLLLMMMMMLILRCHTSRAEQWKPVIFRGLNTAHFISTILKGHPRNTCQMCRAGQIKFAVFRLQNIFSSFSVVIWHPSDRAWKTPYTAV